MDRRTFLHASLGAGMGLGTDWPALFGSDHSPRITGNRHLLVSDHVVQSSRLQMPADHVVARIRMSIETKNASSSESTGLRMPEEKLNLIVAITRHLTNYYGRTDLFNDWSYSLVVREELAGTAWCGIGLGHQFQRRMDLSTLKRKVDWWAFLLPEGTDFEAFDGKPVYVIMVPVFGRCEVMKEFESWSAAMKLTRHMNPQTVARSDVNRATGRINRELARCIREFRDRFWANRNGRQD